MFDILQYGILGEFSTLIVILSIIVILFLLGYKSSPFRVWTIFIFAVLWGYAAPAWLWIIFGIIAFTGNVKPVRTFLVSAPVMKLISSLGIMPAISDTERIALQAGNVWLENEFFSGKPDFRRIRKEQYPGLRDDEKAFLNGPVDEVCAMVDDWDVHRNFDLPLEVWEYLKEKKFFGMVIPKEYGGLGFTANGMNSVIEKLGSRSVPLAVDVMVPNSLGPGELLINYGTDDQKKYYLPRLARGEEMPAFALTEPNAGSDASSLQSHGTVFKGDDGELYIKLNWDKRYITMGAIATILGLAFRLHDPDNLLGKGNEPGITCVLVPTNIEGVGIDKRHNPLGVPFINSPTQGQEVVISINQIIGGPEQAGNGWKMLMETLAGGRGIFIPGLSTGGAKMAARYAGAYSAVRQQFGNPIGRFEGIQERLARIAGITYTMDAFSHFTCGGVDAGNRPAVISAIVKYNASELNRIVVNDAMDIAGGAGIVMGPRNRIGLGYMAVPIGITVEGANILTRSLIVFGQGLIRCHPYVLKLLDALESKNARAFDRALWGHAGMVCRNFFRANLLSLTRGYLAGSPAGGPAAKYYRRLAWASALFALMADLTLGSLGGALKKKEKISGRFADILSWLYMLTAVLNKFEAEGKRKEDWPYVQWSLEYGFLHMQHAFEGLYRNLPVPLIGWILRGPSSAWLRLNPIGKYPSDRLTRKAALAMQTPGTARDSLTNGMFIPADENDASAVLERALDAASRSAPVAEKIRDAVKKGTLKKDKTPELAKQALEQKLISREEYDTVTRAEKLRSDVIKVDAFSLDELPVSLRSDEKKTILEKIKEKVTE